jgi:hypothetical protein
MDRRHVLTSAFTCLLALIVLAAGLARAASGFDLAWWTSDGGGGASSGTGYSLTGTIGQPDAGPLLAGAGYQLGGGFWGGGLAGPTEYPAFLPLIMR